MRERGMKILNCVKLKPYITPYIIHLVCASAVPRRITESHHIAPVARLPLLLYFNDCSNLIECNGGSQYKWYSIRPGTDWVVGYNYRIKWGKLFWPGEAYNDS